MPDLTEMDRQRAIESFPILRQDPGALPGDPLGRINQLYTAMGGMGHLTEVGALSQALQREGALLILDYATQRRLPLPDELRHRYNLDMLEYAIGRLGWAMGRLPEERRREAQSLLFSHARAGVTVLRKDAVDARVLSRAVTALGVLTEARQFESLPRDQEQEVLVILRSVVGRDDADVPVYENLAHWPTFLSATIGLLAKGYVFRELAPRERHEVADRWLSLGMRGMTRASVEDPLPKGAFAALVALAKSHAFQALSNDAKERYALVLLEYVGERVSASPRVTNLERAGQLGFILECLARKHVFDAIPPERRRAVTIVLWRFATQEAKMEIDEDWVRIRTDPTITALRALTQIHIFGSLAPERAREVAILLFEYATGTAALDSKMPDTFYSRERGAREGFRGLHRPHIFQALPGDLQARAASIMLAD